MTGFTSSLWLNDIPFTACVCVCVCGNVKILGGEQRKWEDVVKGTTYQLQNKEVQGI